jgi:hypothetical protein
VSKRKPKPKPRDPMAGCDCKPDGQVHELTCALFKPDWSAECDVCGASPTVPLTGMCGPCTWGEADTIGGNW